MRRNAASVLDAHRHQRVAQVIEPHEAARLVEAFLRGRDRAEGASRRQTRGLRRQALVLLQPPRLEIDVRLDLVGKVFQGATPAEHAHLSG